MADAQIQIIIEATDKITAQLKNIENKISDFGSKNVKATQDMTQAWGKGAESLLAIGNVAATVDNIFSSLTNLELRLENATERLTGAQDRLKDSQKGIEKSQRKLNELQLIYDHVLRNNLQNTEFGSEIIEKYRDASENLTNAQEEQIRANRSLTIAENNLARAQNQVIGTYINIGIQTIGLIASLPKLGKE